LTVWVVSQEGIVPVQASPKGEADVPEFFLEKPGRTKWVEELKRVPAKNQRSSATRPVPGFDTAS
jgi:hypothetical protein